jgi:two-component system, NarL family, response regulator
MSDVNPIRVLIADDHPIVRKGLHLMIKYEPGLETVGEACNGVEAVEQFRIHQPDVALIDLRMPQMGGVEVIRAIRRQFANACLIILTTYDGDEDIFRGLQAGARGYLLKDATCDELLDAIRAVHAGKQCIPSAIGEKLAARLGHPQLSHREQEVVQLMAKGMNNLEIATAMGIAEGTVKYHVNNIFGKLQVSDRTQAVIVALKRGIASLD